MEKLLKDILDILEKVNTTLPKPVMNKKDFDEEYENIEDCIVLIQKLNGLVDNIQQIDILNDKAQVTEQVVELCLNYSNVLWHVQQIDECIKKLIRALPAENLGKLSESYYSYKTYCDDLRKKDINKLDKTFEKMISILEKINNLLIQQNTQEKTLLKEKIDIKNFFSLRDKMILLMKGIQGLLRP